MSKQKQIGAEISSIVRNPKVVIPVIAVMLVPLLYSAMFLGAFWNPYASLDKVPVAIVNEDRGAEMDGEQVSIGEQFVDKLKESDDFAWSFVSKEEALQGFEDNKYYMMLEIPPQFSEQAVSLVTDAPQQAELIYTPNEAYNFLASQIGNTAVSELSSRLNQQITETYVTSIYDKLGEALEGLGAASDGALKIANGAGDASDGAGELAAGQKTLGDGLQKLQSGAATLNTGGKQLKEGLTDLNGGAQSLTKGIGQLNEAGQNLQQGIKQLDNQYQSLDQGLAQSSEGTTTLKQGALGLQAGLKQLASQQQELAQSEAFQQLLAGSDALVQGLLAKEQGEAQLIAGSQAVTGGLSQLNSGSTQLTEALGKLNGGAQQLSTGAQSSVAGATKLSEGINTLHSSTSQLIDGNKKLQDGQAELITGLNKLEDGANELSGKLGNANGEALNLTLTEQMKQQFAKPVTVEKEPYNAVPDYGTGFTPYFISLGLYVGCMLLTIVYSMRQPAGKPLSGTSWYLGKTITVLAISVLQAVVLGVAVLAILPLDVQHMGAFFGLLIITSVSFMMLIQLLCVALDNVGRFVAIILLILQLTSSAGTFPLELVPNWLQAFNPLLPMTYSVLGLKQAISSSSMSLFWPNVWVLLAFAVVCSVLTFIYMQLSYKRQHGGLREEGTLATQ